MFYLYVLKSKKDGKLYFGYTNNLRRRIEEHNKKQEKSTKFRAPFTLVYYEAYKAEDDAKKRGWRLHPPKKKIKKFAHLELISSEGPVAQWLERYAYNVDVGGSTPPRPTTKKGRVAQLVRAFARHAKGQRFESSRAHICVS